MVKNIPIIVSTHIDVPLNPSTLRILQTAIVAETYKTTFFNVPVGTVYSDAADNFIPEQYI